MGNKEILAELKRSYESIQDVIDKADETQITYEDKLKLFTVQDILEKQYSEIYRKIKDENDIELYYEEDIMISNNIFLDYKNVVTNNYLSAEDLDIEWWWDEGFIKEF